MPAIEVHPARILADEIPEIAVSGLIPRKPVSVTATLIDDTGVRWFARGEYIATPDGRADLGREASVGGTYEGIEAAGLFWSMVPTAESVVRRDNPPPVNDSPVLDLARNHTIELSVWTEGKRSAHGSLTRLEMARGVRVEDVIDGDLRGRYYIPAAAASAASPVIVIGGSDGGADARLAPLLASHGIPAFALAYFRYPGRPAELVEIPVEYFGHAVQWALKRSGSNKLAVIGTSRGSEAAALTAIYYPDAVKALVLNVPSHLVNASELPDGTRPAWLVNGKALPWVHGTLDFSAGRRPPGVVAALQYRRIWGLPGIETSTALRLERARTPILLLAGRNDACWPSALAVARIEARLRAAHYAYPVTNLTYMGAGHALLRPGAVTSFSNHSYDPVAKIWVVLGGTPASNAAASRDAWPRTVTFLRDSLQAR